VRKTLRRDNTEYKNSKDTKVTKRYKNIKRGNLLYTYVIVISVSLKTKNI